MLLSETFRQRITPKNTIYWWEMNEEEEKITCARLLIFLNGYDLLSVYPFTRVDVDTPIST